MLEPVLNLEHPLPGMQWCNRCQHNDTGDCQQSRHKYHQDEDEDYPVFHLSPPLLQRMDQPIQVAGTTGRNLLVGNASLLVQLDHLIFSMFVAGITRVFGVCAAVAGGTDAFTLSAVIQWEIMRL